MKVTLTVGDTAWRIVPARGYLVRDGKAFSTSFVETAEGHEIVLSEHATCKDVGEMVCDAIAYSTCRPGQFLCCGFLFTSGESGIHCPHAGCGRHYRYRSGLASHLRRVHRDFARAEALRPQAVPRPEEAGWPRASEAR